MLARSNDWSFRDRSQNRAAPFLCLLRIVMEGIPNTELFFFYQPSTSRASWCRYQSIGWRELSSSWPSVEARWLFHRTWCPKTRPPEPQRKLKQWTKLHQPSQAKVSKEKNNMEVITFNESTILIGFVRFVSHSQSEAVCEGPPGCSKLHHHSGAHRRSGEEADQTLSHQRLRVLRTGNLPGLPGETHSGTSTAFRVFLMAKLPGAPP